MNSYELIALAQEGNEDAINIIYKQIKPIIVEKAKRAIHTVNHHVTNIEKTVMGKDYSTKLIKIVSNNLTTFEKKVLDLKLKDFTLDEMAIELNKDKKSIYNAIQRIKNKFRKISKNDN